MALHLILFLCLLVLSGADSATRIINGAPAAKGQFPWQAHLTIQTTEETLFCGGSLISDVWLLTAAHCVQDPISIIVRLGTVHLADTSTLVIVQAGKVIAHHNFDGTTLANDVALVQLGQRVPLSQFVQPVKLPTRPVGESVPVVVSGWGKISDDSGVSLYLNYAYLTTVSNTGCAMFYGTNFLMDGYLCAIGTTTESICQGDSGGPLVAMDGTDVVIVGIVSFTGSSCTVGAPQGFTRVAAYKQWITANSGVI